jgi:hydrogenase maturation protease
MAPTSDAAISVFAWGNESRGDDAIGAILASRIVDLDNPAINVVEDHQLQIEHVMDIVENVPMLFIDASVAIDTDYLLEKLTPFRDASISTHAISPVALLDLYEQTLGKSAPDAYLLHVRGNSFELGEEISAATSESVNKAWRFLDDLFARPRGDWGPTLRAASSENSA